MAPGGAYVAYQSDREVWFLDVRSGEMSPPVKRAATSGSWHPDGVRFVTATDDSVAVLDPRNGDVMAERTMTVAPYREVDYGTDGRRLVLTVPSGVQMLDAATLKTLGNPVRLDEVACQVSLGPGDTAVVVTGPAERLSDFYHATCTRWALVDLGSGAVLEQGELPVSSPNHVEFSPDGRHAAVGTEFGEVFVLDLETGAPVRPPAAGHDGFVESLAYSPDGQRLLSAGTDSGVVVWEGATGRLDSRVVAPESFVTAGFGADTDSVLISPAWGGPVYRWDTSVETALDFACEAAGRDFTDEEWRQQFGDRPYEETCPGY